MTKEFELLMEYKKLARKIAELEGKILTLLAHPEYPDEEMLTWRAKYRELRALHNQVRHAMNRKGIRI